MISTSYLVQFVRYLKIPKRISNEEILTRILNPMHYKEKNGKIEIHKNAFRPPNGRNDISVARFNHSTEERVRIRGEQILGKQEEILIGQTIAAQVSELGLSTIYTPQIFVFPEHADIVIGVIVEKGKTLPVEVNNALRNLAKGAKTKKI